MSQRHNYLASYGFSDEALAHRARHQAVNEQGSYEVHEHYERKIQRIKPKKKRQQYVVRDVQRVEEQRDDGYRKQEWVSALLS